MKILVPLKRVADPDNANKVKVNAGKLETTGLEWKPNPFDEYAVESALRLNENAKTGEKLGETIVVSLGGAEPGHLRKSAHHVARMFLEGLRVDTSRQRT